jgi:hypothetical protein
LWASKVIESDDSLFGGNLHQLRQRIDGSGTGGAGGPHDEKGRKTLFQIFLDLLAEELGAHTQAAVDCYFAHRFGTQTAHPGCLGQ